MKKRKNRKLLAFTVILTLAFSMFNSANVVATRKLLVTSKKSFTLSIGKKSKIKTNVKAIFKSSNKKIATVNKKGIVSAKKVGNTKITVTSKKNNRQKVTVKVKVVKTKSNSTTLNISIPTLVPTATPVETSVPTLAPTATPVETSVPTLTPTAIPVETSVPTFAPTETPRAVSLTAEYTGGLIPTSSSLDYFLLIVTATFEDGTSRRLNVGEFNLTKDYTKYEGECVLDVSYQDLTASFIIYAKDIDLYKYDYGLIMTIEYSGTMPLDTSKLIVKLLYRSKSIVIEDYQYVYLGIIEKNGEKYHKYLFYFTEDFNIEDVDFHNFVCSSLLIPI